jgi:hypothetical protein
MLAWMRAGILVGGLAAVLTPVAVAQVVTTHVADTVYRADGTPASGTVLVSWSAFTTASGAAAPAGSTTTTLGTGGALSVYLAANAGATPMGSYYTAVYHLNDGTTSREYWVVPVVAGGGAATLSGIRNQVLPASVAMQTVSKAYVDTAIAAAGTGGGFAGSGCTAASGSLSCTGAMTVNTGGTTDGTVLTIGGSNNLHTIAAPLGEIQFTEFGNASLYLEYNGNTRFFHRVTVPALATENGGNADLAGSVTLAAGSTTSPTVTFALTYSLAPICTFFPQNATASVVAGLGAIAAQVSTTAAYATVVTAPSGAVVLGYHCIARY